jgi:hypothetical protein
MIPEEFIPGHVYRLFDVAEEDVNSGPVYIMILRILKPADNNGLSVVDVLRESGDIEHGCRLSLRLWRLVV